MRVVRSLAARIHWLLAGEALGHSPPGLPPPPPPGPGLREFFLQPGRLPDGPPVRPQSIAHQPGRTDAPPAGPTAAARPAFWRWLLSPEQLPPPPANRNPDPES